jgi:hypothetical protein
VLTNTDLPRDFAGSGVNKRVNKALTKGLTNDPGKVWDFGVEEFESQGRGSKERSDLEPRTMRN